MLPACLALRAARSEFWNSKDPASWSDDEKQFLLGQSPWAREGLVRMEEVKDRRTTPGYGNDGRLGGDMPEVGPGIPPGGMRSVTIGEVPPPPNPDPGHPVEFRVLVRWESARPVRLAGGPELPELTGQFYVIRLRGLPLMPPPKTKPDEVAPNPNEGMLQAIEQGRVPLRAARSGQEVLRGLPRHSRGRRSKLCGPAGTQPKSECLFGTLGMLGQERMSFQAHSVR